MDEYKLLLGDNANIPPKRYDYILKKWEEKGWYVNPHFTDKFYRIYNLALTKNEAFDKLDGHVVIVEFLPPWKINNAIGILEYCGDNGWYLSSKIYKSTTSNYSHYLGHYPFDDIAYIEQHPKPQKIWERLNYLYWKYHKIPDRFHQKITPMSFGTICDYSRANEGIYTYSHPLGKIGDCFPSCQCKTI